MPVRIVVGSRIKKKIRIQIQEIVTGEKNKEKTKNSENMTIYDDEGKINIKELFKEVEETVTNYAEKKGEVTKY